MRIATTGKLAVFATAVSMLVSGAAFAQGATPATPATQATPATPAAPAATKDNATKDTHTKAKAEHKRTHRSAHKAKVHRKEKAAG